MELIQLNQQAVTDSIDPIIHLKTLKKILRYT